MDDDSKLLGLVLGATLSVSLGLFTVALCHYLGVARIWMILPRVDVTDVGVDCTSEMGDGRVQCSYLPCMRQMCGRCIQRGLFVEDVGVGLSSPAVYLLTVPKSLLLDSPLASPTVC